MLKVHFTGRFDKGAFWPQGAYPTPTIERVENGRVVRERIPAKLAEPMVDPAGHVVYMTYNHSASERDKDSPEAIHKRHLALALGWIPYRECPMHYPQLRGAIPAAVLKEHPAPCKEFTEPDGSSRARKDRKPCVHVAAIEEIRKATTADAHTKATAHYQNSNDQIARTLAGLTDVLERFAGGDVASFAGGDVAKPRKA